MIRNFWSRTSPITSSVMSTLTSLTWKQTITFWQKSTPTFLWSRLSAPSGRICSFSCRDLPRSCHRSVIRRWKTCNTWPAMFGMTNYGWFQFQVYRMCNLLLNDRPLLWLLSELKNAFQDPTPRPFSQIAAKLEAIHPGLGREMGALWRPTTLPDSQAKPCRDGAASDKDSDLVVVNSSSTPVKVTSGKDAPVAIASNSWYTFSGHSGAFVRTDTGACFVFGDESTIARIPAKVCWSPWIATHPPSPW